MKTRTLTIIILLTTVVFCEADPVGTWKNYMSYSDITDVKQGGNMLYVLASNSLFTYNTNDQSIQTYDKATGLNDCVIDMIEWNTSTKKLIIVYSDYNIDIMDANGNVSNLADYYNKALTYDKTVYGIDMIDNYAYLSTGFGIMKIDMANVEISNTYNLGFRVDYCYISDGMIYAASSTNGTYAASLSDNLIDPASWSYQSAYTAKNTAVDPDLLALAKTLNPGGPDKNWFYYIKYAQNRIYSAGGMWYSGMGSDPKRTGTIQVLDLDNDEWSKCEDDVSSITGWNYIDINSVEPDPKDPNHLFAGGKTGMYEFQDYKLVNYFNSDNSPIQCAVDGGKVLNNNYVFVYSMLYDKDETTLWLLNCQCESNSIMEYNTLNGEFTLHDKDELIDQGASLCNMKSLIQDSNGNIWFANDHHWLPSFYCYNPTTDAMLSFIPTQNQDGTSLGIYAVRCVAEDLDGNIWAGTDQGPIVLYASDITSSSPVFNEIKVPRNDGTNYADYLLDVIDIICIAIDGADRKWIGTDNNGVYLISADNMEQLQHFTAENSPLLSNEVFSITINNATGEVFFGTENGLCSYVSDAIEASEKMSKSSVYAYPNPVKPDYTGDITINGLSFGAYVKIVTANGVLVAEGRSNGGMFTWDGCDLNGKKVVAGVYMVEAATSEGEKGTVCKVAIVR
ncbi:MAG: Por secretion system protein [Prevotella sp.]|nr:Por secretion system protein [Prevotella sp.]